MDDAIFFQRLLNETYRKALKTDCNQKSGDLLQYFRTRESQTSNSEMDAILHNYLNRERINFYKCEYIDEIFCFRIYMSKRFVDIPRNWSIFQNIYSTMQFEKKDGLFLIDDGNDNDELLKIFSSLADYKSHLLFILIDNQIYTLFLPKDSPKSLEWVKNYFGHTNHSKKLKAA
ncbi:MAG: hypothetical protein ISR65_00440 [Bacteriovoracaceae bacterium]|nr:hypothetical protein [Bacteriovoracaceae bacterium]